MAERSNETDRLLSELAGERSADQPENPRMIDRTGEPQRHPWPEDCYVQGGSRGIVLGGADGPYRTAFVEAFPRNPDTFIRGEGPAVADAENACWAKYERVRDCADGSGQHGPYDARDYRNGAGYCTRCGAWFSKVLPVQPEDPDREVPLMERVLTGDNAALGEVVGALAHVDELPEGGGRRG